MRDRTKLSEAEQKKRQQMCANVVKIGATTSLMIMIVGAAVVARLATSMHGYDAFYTALFGSMLVCIVGTGSAYAYGCKMGKLYGRYIQLYEKTH